MLNWFFRSAVKGFGIERFKGNCVKATEGFNIVLQHFQDQQCHLRKIRFQKWQEMRDRGEQLREKISLNSKECWKQLSPNEKKSINDKNQLSKRKNFTSFFIHHQRINTPYYILPAYGYARLQFRDQPLHWIEELKFIYSEKATKFCEMSTNYLSYVLPVK